MPDPAVRLPAPNFACPGHFVHRADPTGDVIDTNYHRIASRPDFDITDLRVTRAGSGPVCVELGLAGRPRADAVYGVFVSAASFSGSPGPNAALIVDGAGGLHLLNSGRGVIFYPSIRALRPRWGWTGHSLVFRFDSHRRLPLPRGHLTVKSATGGDFGLVEPLIANPYRYDGAPAGTCIRFPSG